MYELKKGSIIRVIYVINNLLVIYKRFKNTIGKRFFSIHNFIGKSEERVYK